MKKTIKKSLLIIGLALAVILPAQVVFATNKPTFVNGTLPSGKIVAVPQKAVEVAPNVFYIGESFDEQSGQTVQGYAFVTPKNESAKPDGTPGGSGKDNSGSGGTTTSSCFAYISKGAYWKNNEQWLVTPTNTAKLDESYVFDTMVAGVSQWEDAASGALGDGKSVDIFGNGTKTYDPLSLDTSSTDGKNEVLFGSISDPGVIAVTYTWGIFGGSPNNRMLVEWDMLFDQESFSWTNDGSQNPDSMDFANIAVHELGHAFGLSHPEDSCTEETMFRFASSGETKKIDLNAGDITGISKLY